MGGSTVAFTLAQFQATRPYLYHLTSQRNLIRLLDERLMYSAAELLKWSGTDEYVDKHRAEK